MTDNVGLSTPRGSGTSGYIQRNLSHLKPRSQPQNPTNRFSPYNKPSHDELLDAQRYRQRQPDAEILEHERRRKLEVQVMELRDKLEDEGVDEDDIDVQTEALRKKLMERMEAPPTGPRRGPGNGEDGGGEGRDRQRDVPKRHQVHELAEMKIKESEKLRRALGIREGYEEGSHWREKDERDKKRSQVGKEEES